MNFDINQVIKDIENAIAGIYNENYSQVKDMTQEYLDSSKIRLESLLTDISTGSIDNEFFNKRLADEQAILESQLLSFKVAGVSVAKEAASKGIEILFKIVDNI